MLVFLKIYILFTTFGNVNRIPGTNWDAVKPTMFLFFTWEGRALVGCTFSLEFPARCFIVLFDLRLAINSVLGTKLNENELFLL